MELDLITEQRLKDLEERVEELQQVLREQQANLNPRHVLLDNSNLLHWMRISRGTLQSWRDQQYIAFIQIDSKVYYTLADVMEFLEKHRRKARE